MEIKLVEPSHPILREKLQDFDFNNPPVDPIDLANSLIQLMKDQRGIGLSANQCGLPYRVFVLWSEKPFVCFNPRIIDQTSDQVMLEEGCLSFPHLVLKVKRPSTIKVRFQDAFGEMHTEKFVGMTARAFQHELDHLNGVMFQSRANPIHLQRALNQQKNTVRKLKRGEVRIIPNEIKYDEAMVKESAGQLQITTTDKKLDVASTIQL
jgi:peptide deformylase